jgi:diguanylate cyclase (GGDEF)-like protein
MSSALSLLLVTMALSLVMLLVLFSLLRSDVRGIPAWLGANALAVGGLLLFAGRGALPDLLSIELANAAYLGAIGLMLAGMRQHLVRSVPVRLLAAGAAAALAALAWFHLAVDMPGARVVAVSTFHGAVCLAIGVTVWRAPRGSHTRYPVLFTALAAFALGAGHLLRGAVYLSGASLFVSPLQSAGLNLVFLALGTLAFPLLTLGAVMMANAEIISRTRYAADHDHLTGAWSRRAFFQLADKEYARAVRSGGAVSVLLFDVDHFKRINDTHGHAVGDRVLREIVQATNGAIRTLDTCARMGGEEFAVLLPDADPATARRVAERLRTALDCAPSAGAEVAYTVSVGVATLQDGENIADTLARADGALYLAKAAGRNCVMAAPAWDAVAHSTAA